MTTGKAMRRILDELDEKYEEYDLEADYYEDRIMVIEPMSLKELGYIEEGHYFDY